MDNSKFVLIGVGIGAAVIAALVLRKAGGVAGDALANAANAINPFNNDNIINRAFTDLYQGVTGSDDTLGGDIYDITHIPEENKIGYTPKPTSGQIARQENIGSIMPAYPVPGGYGDTSKYFHGRDMVRINGGWGIE